MARIVVLQHSRRGTPGRLGMTLRDLGFKLDIHRLDLTPEHGGRPVPPDLDDVHGVLSLGGPQNVDESHPWLKPELEFLKAAHDAALPVVGVCLGAQLIAEALGGKVGKMDTPECGFAPVDILFPGQTETILAGIPWRSWQFHLHGYEVKQLPPGAVLLASSEHCKVQIFKAGFRTVGFQFHPEYDRAAIEATHAEAEALFNAAGVSVDELARQTERHYPQYARLSDRLALNLATLCFTFRDLLAV